MVPPPTRRCTGPLTSVADRAHGSSAHAEMHPAQPQHAAPRAGFLRPRGDAPGTCASDVDHPEVPPPTRRCTGRGAFRGREGTGSSAHAEMHRRRGPGRCPRPRFLRPRGDAPKSQTSPSPSTMVPPPTRRCTGGRGRSRSPHAGSSAHAEMHPRRGLRPRGRAGFLRPRGDAPSETSREMPATMVPPPTRRCTPSDPGGSDRASGSSAHAEMHPAEARPDRRRRWFLRPRGDAPHELRLLGAYLAVPPPTRRCTGALPFAPYFPAGSSAHAEMHPRRATAPAA